MSTVNKRATSRNVPRTFEGAPAKTLTDVMALRRSVVSCLLWEGEFYESGQVIADRIKALALKVSPEAAMQVAVEARTKFKLRHAPLWVARALAQGNAEQRQACGQLLPQIILRPDELTEFLALYWGGTDRKVAKQPLSAQVKKGLAVAFRNFKPQQLAKYRSDDSAIKLRDVMFLVCPVPKDAAQAAAFTQLASKELRLQKGQTWEETLSAGRETKQESWTELLRGNKLGALALLRNLRNMLQEGVSPLLIKDALARMKTEWVEPFRFITAARYAPRLEEPLQEAMFRCLADMPKLLGKTALVIDRSGSMTQHKLSAKSEIDRLDAAAALAMLLREICDEVQVYTFSNEVQEVPPRRGFGLKDAIRQAPEGASFGGKAVQQANRDGYDRIIVVTDGQWHTYLTDEEDRQFRESRQRYGRPHMPFNVWEHDGRLLREKPAIEVSPVPLTEKAYLVNIASQTNGVGSNRWHMIDGWSEAIVGYIQAIEQVESQPLM